MALPTPGVTTNWGGMLNSHITDDLAATLVPQSPGGTSVTTGGAVVAPTMVDGAVSGRRHNAFPTIARLSDGRYIKAWRGAWDHEFTADGDLYISVSSDGYDWAAPTLIDLSDVPSHVEVRDPCVSVTSDGTVLLAFYDKGPAKSYLKKSTDDGATWTAPVELPFTGTTYSFLSAPIVEMDSGAWLAAAYDGASPARTQVIRSTDQGATWSAPVNLTPPGSVGFQEPNIISLDGTNALLLARGSDGLNMYSFTSADDGVTWSTVANAFLGTGNPHAVRFASGAIACLYRDSNTGAAAIRTSHDDGATWTRQTLFGLASTFMAYAHAVESDTPGQAVVVWSAEENGPARLYMGTVSESGGVSPLGGIPHPRAVTGAEVPPRKYIPASQFDSVAGAPNKGVVSVTGAWMMDPAASEAVAVESEVPAEWTKFDVIIHCTPSTTAGGDIVFDISHQHRTQTSTMGTGTFVNGSQFSAGTVVGARRTRRMLTDLANIEGGVWWFRVIRDGPNASDTYGGDVAFLGIELVRKG